MLVRAISTFFENIINISKTIKNIDFRFLHVILPITAYIQEHAEFTSGGVSYL